MIQTGGAEVLANNAVCTPGGPQVRSADEFYVQMVDEPRVAWLEEQLAALGLEEGQAPRLAVGAPCLARFTLDNQW